MRRTLGVLVLLVAPAAHALTVLTTGKQAVFRADSALVRVGRDRAFATLADPTCAGGAVTKLEIGSFPEATWRVVSSPETTLDCARWQEAGGGYVYDDPDGSALGLQHAELSRAKLVLQLGGPHYQPLPGPVGYAETWLTLGDRRLLARFHLLRENTATLVVAKKPSAAAAAGEAAFWDVLHGDDRSTARQRAALRLLGKAVRIDRRDGWSGFLAGMMHLYRFALETTDFRNVSAKARREIDAAGRAFERAVPLVWDGSHGDSRVPGFAAAAKFVRGYVAGDDALAAEGLADLDAAIAVNGFFNVFDLIPVIQALPPGDPRFAAAFGQVSAYLGVPANTQCPHTQPEICENRGLAPRNFVGSILLFGDVYAKAGDLARARFWYSTAPYFAAQVPGYRFQGVVDDRAANYAARVAAYLNADPNDDPPVVGMGAEACAACHNR